jgi:hypothetical protein
MAEHYQAVTFIGWGFALQVRNTQIQVHYTGSEIDS